MLFGAPRHVVLLIQSPIMPDAVWCIPTRGITYSISHHDGCCLVHPDMWYYLFGLPSCRMLFGAPRHVVLLIRSPIMPNVVWCIPTRGINIIRHHDGCPIGASRHVGHWKISGCLRDGCRFVHPVRRFIRYINQFTFMTDSV